jgi:hypothetical protein
MLSAKNESIVFYQYIDALICDARLCLRPIKFVEKYCLDLQHVMVVQPNLDFASKNMCKLIVKL